ncbi:MAG: glycosyltransferase family 4 protein [Treponema sp.]|nr:glycosyltransferase family 4 protein [Treponema sp.]
MKIGIDTFGCNHGNSDTGLYLLSLAKYLKNDENMEFEFFGEEEDRYIFNHDNNFKFVPMYLPEKHNSPFWWHIVGFNTFCRIQKYDLVIIPSAIKFIPLFSPTPIIAILTDVISNSYKNESFLKRLCIKIGLKNAKKIIVPSKFIKNSLKSLRINQEKISVIHSGIDHSIFYARAEVSEKYVEVSTFSIQKPYFIFVAAISSPEKRHCELIRAFSIFRSTHPDFKHKLVLTGNEGEYIKEVQNEIAQSPFATDIIITGYIPHEEFPKLYSEADGFIFPSENESVGMTIIEAMAAGIPVACSKSGALTEIAGDSALFFDSRNIDEIAKTLETIAKKNKKDINTAEEISWAKRFDWAKTSEELLNTIKKLIAK